MAEIDNEPEGSDDDIRSALESAFDAPEPNDEAPQERARDESGRFAKSDSSSEAPKQSEPSAQRQGETEESATSRKMPASW